MTMAIALKGTGIGGAIFLVVVFAAFFCLSCIILIIMEGVSAMVSPLPPSYPCILASVSSRPLVPYSRLLSLECVFC
jgi:V-type H+-transporting ATPase subunit a